MLISNNYNEFFSTYATSGYLPSLKYIPKEFVVQDNTLSYDTLVDQQTIYYGSLPDTIFFQDDPDVRWDILHSLDARCVDLNFYYVVGEPTTLTQYGRSDVANISNMGSVLYFQQIDGKNNVCIFSPETEDVNYHFYLNNIVKKSIYGFNFSSSFYGLQSKGMKYTKQQNAFAIGETIQNAVDSSTVTGTAQVLEDKNSGTSGRLLVTNITGTWTVNDTIYSSTGVTKAIIQPEYGSVFFNTQSNDIKSKLNWLSSRKTDSATIKAGSVELLGTESQHIQFPSSFSTTDYAIFGNIYGNIGENFYSFVIKNKTTTGFDIVLSGEFDANEYIFDWYAISTVGITNAGVASIPTGATSLTISVPSGYSEYIIFYSIENEGDFGSVPTSTAYQFLSTISNKTASSFTVNFSTTIPSSNYKLNWMVLPSLDQSQFTQQIASMWPRDVELVDSDNAKGYFTQPFTGIVNVKKLGNIVDEEEKYPAPIGTNNVFSPHYKIQMDINNEPISSTENAIISSKIEKSLYEEWEKFRPEGKVAHYQLYFLINNFSSYGIPSSYYHYDSTLVNWLHNSLVTFNLANNAYIFSNMTEASKTWTIPHNLGTKSLVIQTFTKELKRIYPKHIIMESQNSIEVQFEYEQQGYVFISKASEDVSFYIDTPSQVITYEHDLGTNNLIFQIDKEFFDKESVPYALNISDENSVNFTFDKLLALPNPLYGNVLLLHGDGVYEQSEASELWEIRHNSGYKVHMYQVYTETGDEIIPKDVEFIDENLMTVTFGSPVSGKIVLKNIGNNPQNSDGVLLEKAQKGKLELRIGNKKESLSAVQLSTKISNIILTQPITSYEVDETYITLNFEIPWKNNYEIYQWGLYEESSLGNLLYAYSCGDLIYKLDGINLLISYKIKKTEAV